MKKKLLGWSLLSNREPDNDIEYFVYHEAYWYSVFQAFYDRSSKAFVVYDWEGIRLKRGLPVAITHYMPIPKRPKPSWMKNEN